MVERAAHVPQLEQLDQVSGLGSGFYPVLTQRKTMGKALNGIRVLDMTHVQMGPSSTQILAWLGADVIKVELPGRGDITRQQLRDLPDVDSLYFTMLNCNKRSITINTKTNTGQAIFRKLIEACDVLVENFAPGALDRQGFSWDVIQKINPRIIYASGKGFGSGPFADCKAYETVAQAMGGAMSTTGWDEWARRPVRVPRSGIRGPEFTWSLLFWQHSFSGSKPDAASGVEVAHAGRSA